MAITIGSNISSLVAQRFVAESSNRLYDAQTRLASGQRINRAGDDAAGLSIASSLRKDARVYAQGLRNINDASSALAIAEGALSNLSLIATRIRELAEQSANGTFSLVQRQALNAEADELTSEFNRITASTSFNGISLLSGGSFRLRIQAGYGLDGGIDVGLNQEFSREAGTGSFTQSTFALTGGSADGKADLVVRRLVGGLVDIYTGNGSGGFSLLSSVSSAGGGGSVALVDLDSDGDLDIVNGTGGTGVNFEPTSSLSIMRWAIFVPRRTLNIWLRCDCTASINEGGAIQSDAPPFSANITDDLTRRSLNPLQCLS